MDKKTSFKSCVVMDLPPGHCGGVRLDWDRVVIELRSVMPGPIPGDLIDQGDQLFHHIQLLAPQL